MSLSLLTGDPLKVAHFRGRDWRSNDGEIVYLSRLVSGLIVLEKELKVSNCLELYEAQIDRWSVKLVGRQPETDWKLCKFKRFHVRAQVI